MTVRADMSLDEQYPTCYGLAPVCDERRAPSITECEQAALKGVDLVERAADPLNRFTLARLTVRIVATLARRARRG